VTQTIIVRKAIILHIKNSCGKDPVPSKICINNQILERVNVFKYLSFNLSFLEDLDISEKIARYNKSIGIINSVMKQSLVQKHTRMRLHKTLARPVLCYGSEAWTMRNRDKSRLLIETKPIVCALGNFTL
jgi:hypothetical protein